MDKDELKGKGKQAMGGMKETAGRATGNEDMQAGGREDKMEGRGQEGLGKVKGAAKDLKDKVTD